MFESTCKSTSQNAIRGGSATCNIQFWHYEIEDVVVLKNNAGTDDNRVRKLDYIVHFSKIFYERLIKGEDITLFSPEECPELYSAFGLPEFDELYKAREKDKSLKFRKTISAKAFAELFTRERLETGRIYVMNIDNVNNHSTFYEKIEMTNLCNEVLFPVVPIKSIEDKDGEIGVCCLSAINLLETSFDEYESICDIVVRLLDELIDYQEYALPAAKSFCVNRRALGIGITNLAGLFAKNKIKYESQEALELADKIGEYMSYYCIQSSINLAKEKGKCKKNKYDNGEFPIDSANKNALKLTTREFELDWETLRTSVKENGVRNSTLLSIMPAESSSVIQNSTNGIEPIRSLLAFKESKKGILKQLAPNLKRYGKYYTLAWDIKDNTCLTNISAVLQKWIDMGISTNHYYNYAHHEGGNIPLSRIIKDMIYAYKVGVKTLYYANTPDGSAEMTSNNSGCDSGACAI
jgi:ribonucleoside-diphosphate reductase alpha chain